MTKTKYLSRGTEKLAVTFLMSALAIGVVSLAAFTKLGAFESSSKVGSEEVKPDSAPQTGAVTNSTITQLCFVRDKWIYLSNLKTGNETRLVEGQWPDLSPTGDAVAFMAGKHYDEPLADPIPPQGRVDPWRIKLLDLRTKETRDISSLANVRAFLPRWSNDGSRIAFEVINAEATRLDIGVLDPATENWQRITKDLDLGNPGEPLSLDEWVSGDRSLLFHTLENLYEVSLDGKLLRKIPIENLCPIGEIGSNTKFSLSLDGRHLLFDTITDPENMSISIFDLNDKKLMRVTPNQITATSPLWLPSNKEILFTCAQQSQTVSTRSICKISTDGTKLSVVASNADLPSFSNQ